MNRNVQSLFLVAAGGVLVWITADGSYVRYVRQAAGPWLLVAAVALILIGLLLLWADNEAALAARVLSEEELARRETPATTPGADGTDGADGHTHGRGARRVPLLLILPLLALFLVQPRALGAFTAERARPAHLDKPAGVFHPLVGPDPVEISLLDLNERAAYGGAATLTGHTLVITGFVTPRPGGQGTDFYVNRLLIWCCAADATPIRARVVGAPSGYKTGTWLRVIGSYTGNEQLPDPTIDPIPTLRVVSVKKIHTPDQPYAN